MYRKIEKYFSGKLTSDGAGVKLHRVFGYYEIPEFDPFFNDGFFLIQRTQMIILRDFLGIPPIGESKLLHI